MKVNVSIGKWDVQLTNTARWGWTHFNKRKTETGWHLVWGKLSLLVEDGTLEVFPVCAECGSSSIGEQGYGDEGWTVCEDCRSIEQGYEYISYREASKRDIM